MDINSLLKTEAVETVKLQKSYKAIITDAIKKHGLDKAKIMEEIKPKIEKLSSDNARMFLKMGMEWLK